MHHWLSGSSEETISSTSVLSVPTLLKHWRGLHLYPIDSLYLATAGYLHKSVGCVCIVKDVFILILCV